MSRRPINFDTDRRRVRSRSRGNRLERDTDEDRIQGERGRARVQRSFHAELDDLEAKVRLATDNDNNNSNQPLEKLPPLNSNYLRQKSRIPVPTRDVDGEDQSKSSMDEIINKFSKKTEIKPAKSKFDELYNKSAILEKHKQFVKPRLTSETEHNSQDQYTDDDQRDREFEERRRKIEIEQDLIYEQEEQHFREVVEAESEAGNQGIDIDGEKREYQAALHQEIAALETLEQNPIKLFSLDDKSYGTIESRQSDYYNDSVRNVQDADDANSELATDDFHFEEKFHSEKIRSRNQDKLDDFPPPPPAAKTSYFEKNKPQKVENSLPRAWEKIRPVEKNEPVYPHPILFAMENKRNISSKPVHQEETMFQRQAVEQVTVRSEPDVNQFEPKYEDERPISGTGNYVIPDTDSTYGYARQEQPIEQKIITEKQSFIQQPTVCETVTDTPYKTEPSAFPRDLQRKDPVRDTFGALPAMKQADFPAAPKRDLVKDQKSYTVEPSASREPVRESRSYEPSRDFQPARQQELSRESVRQPEPVVRDYLKPKLDSTSSVDRLLSKFSEKATENTESSYLSRPSDRRSSTSSNSSFQARINSVSNEKPKIKLQPTQYGRTQYTSKSNGDFNYAHASIRRNEKTPVSSLINRFNPSAMSQGPSKGDDWMPATLKRVKRPSVKSQIAGLEKLSERPEQQRTQLL